MRLNCGPTWREKLERLENWHPFFPWWPRRVGSGDCRCFEWIERRGEYSGYCGHWNWEYRLPQPKQPENPYAN